MLSGNFTWGVGVIEDRNDPDKLGRFRVRILGAHTENKNNIPTEELPWATSIQPITSSSMNGIGTSPTGIVKDHGYLYFLETGVICKIQLFSELLLAYQ